jgi:hypothetical protein
MLYVGSVSVGVAGQTHYRLRVTGKSPFYSHIMMYH